MRHHTYTTRGTCSRSIDFDLDEQGRIHNLSFFGGCSGNLQGLARLAEGLPAAELAAKLRGTLCGSKNTSCPDQLAVAIEKALSGQ